MPDRFVDYVRTTGEQYMILDYTPGSNTVVEVDLEPEETGTKAVFCARGSTTSTRTYSLFNTTSDHWRFDYCANNANSAEAGAVVGTRTVLRTSCNGLSIDGEKATSYEMLDFAADNKMMLFAAYTAAAGALSASTTRNYYLKAKIYRIRIWDDGGETLRFDLKPCMSGARYGLYDEVSGDVLYTSLRPLSGKEHVFTDDPLVISTAAKYSAPVIGSGTNAVVFRGTGDKSFTCTDPVRNFSSVTIEDGEVHGDVNVRDIDFLPGATISLETARLGLDFPNDNAPVGARSSNVTVHMYCATNGSVRFGPDSVVEVKNRSSGTGYSQLHLGRLVRADAGGTLMLASRMNNASYYGFSYLGGRAKIFVEGVDDGAVLPAYMVGGYWSTGASYVPFSFLKYSSASGVLPADMVGGFDVAGESDIVNLTSAAVVSGNAHVGGIRIDNTNRLEIAEGATLSLGDGRNPAGVIVNHKSYSGNPAVAVVAGSGELAFGGSQGVFWSSRHDKVATLGFGNVAITGTNGVVFAGRENGVSWSNWYNPKLSNWKWTGPTYVDDCVLYITDDSMTSIDCDLYIRGNSANGASLYLNNSDVGTFSFGGHVHFTGPGYRGMAVPNGNSDRCVSLFRNRGGSANRNTNFNGPVTIKHNVQFCGNGQYFLNFNGPIDGEGSIYLPMGSVDVRFNGTNTYVGATVVNSGTLCVRNAGTLGFGDVTVGATLRFENKAGYAMGNAFSGTGNMNIVNSSLVFSNDVSIGTLTFDANSSAAFGGAVAATAKLTFPAGASLSAVDGTSPTLTVPDGAVLAGAISNVDVAVAGVVTNRGAIAVSRVDAARRIDPVVLDGDAVFSGATFTLAPEALAAAKPGTHVLLSVTGSVEGEPAFSTGKYRVVRDGNTWSVTKPGGLSIVIW